VLHAFLTREVLDMCMNCGCQEYETKHKPTDITLSQLKAAAKGHDMEVEEAADNIHDGAEELKKAGKID
jgi:predicted  nucleic acid-binding Zn-ribbon protein